MQPWPSCQDKRKRGDENPKYTDPWRVGKSKQARGLGHTERGSEEPSTGGQEEKSSIDVMESGR